MPYQKGYRRGKRRRPYRRNGDTFSNMYKTVSKYTNWATMWSAIKDIKSLINVERKFLDISVTNSTISKTTIVDWITSIAEGSDYNQRTGISVKADSIYLRGSMALPSTATTGHVVRHVVICDTDNTGTAPTAADVFETASDPYSPLNHTNGKRFQVLYDKLHTLSTTGPDIKSFKIFKKLGSHIRWSNSTTGTREGHIYSLYLTDTNTAAEECNFNYDSRLRFIDN